MNMEARNSFGRKISLLNDSEEAERPSGRLPSLFPHRPSRTSSYASTASASITSTSPDMPPLVRSNSADSGAMQTPSPITPTFNLDAFHVPQPSGDPTFSTGHPFYPGTKDSSMYPPIPQQHAPYSYTVPPLSASPPSNYFRTSPSPGSENPISSSASTSKPPPPKKNSYPCPMAKQFNCNDHFTTSGHAARHAKKHTGRKDAFCPECNKAFTRKDNMEQHRRTHQNGRNASRSSGDSQARKAKKQHQRSKPTPLQQASLPVLDPSLPTSPASSFGFGETLAPAVQPIQAYPQDCVPNSYQHMPYPLAPRFEPLPQHFTNGLDTLAIAATGEDRQRKYPD